MDNIDEEYQLYWETNMFLHNEELDSSWGLDEVLAASYDSNSPDAGEASPSAAAKNILSERNRRKKLNNKLFALRSVVPNITKMDKASIIKDAISYIQKLQQEERRIQSEIVELESGAANNKNGQGGRWSKSKKAKTATASPDGLGHCDYQSGDSSGRTSPLKDIEVTLTAN